MAKRKMSTYRQFNEEYYSKLEHILNSVEKKLGFDKAVLKLKAGGLITAKYIINERQNEIMRIIINNSRITAELSKEGEIMYGAIIHYFNDSENDVYSKNLEDVYKMIKDIR